MKRNLTIGASILGILFSLAWAWGKYDAYATGGSANNGAVQALEGDWGPRPERPREERPEGERRERRPPEWMTAEVRAKLDEARKAGDDAKVREIFRQAIPPEEAAEMEARRNEMMARFAIQREKVEAILSPEELQQLRARFEERRARFAGRRGPRGGGGRG